MVVAYGRIIPVAVLDRLPMVNLHFSLLPRWRGAAPVERAILEGDAETGVCLMAVEAGLDTGPVYAESTTIGEEETADELRDRLVVMGCRLLERHWPTGWPGCRGPGTRSATRPTPRRSPPAELALHWEEPATRLRRVIRVGRAWTTFRGAPARAAGGRGTGDNRRRPRPAGSRHDRRRRGRLWPGKPVAPGDRAAGGQATDAAASGSTGRSRSPVSGSAPDRLSLGPGHSPTGGVSRQQDGDGVGHRAA